MSTVREKLLPVVSKLRVIADTKLGLRRYTVYTRRKAPSDGVGGLGATWTNTDTLLAEKPRIRQATVQDTVRSAGRIETGTWMMEALTPRNEGNTVGTVFANLFTTPVAAGEECLVVLDGPGMPAYSAGPPPTGGGEFTITKADPTGNFEFTFLLMPAAGRSIA